MKTQKKKTSLGGQAIASGTYGCVFSPPLKCKGEERPNGKVVSKLLTTKDANNEINEAKEIKEKLKENFDEEKYKRYFIFPEKQCEPDALTTDDLVNFDNVCTNMEEVGINKRNINNKLGSVSMLELTNGGSDLDKKIKDIEIAEIGILNKSIIDLLKNAVVPMNRLGIVHFDVKSPNILIDEDQLRIIDWGLARLSKNNEIPPLSAGPIQYNAPFGIVLLYINVVEYIDKALKEMILDNNYKETIKPEMTKIIDNIVLKNFSKPGHGHVNAINERLSTHLNTETQTFTHNLLTNYLTEAVLHNINPVTKEFDATKYYNEVFSKNCDIWGTLTIYDDILQKFDGVKLPEILERLRDLVMLYLYSDEFAGKPINIDELVDELNDIFSDTNNSPIKSGSRKSKKSSVKRKNKKVKKTVKKRCKNRTRRNKKTR
jgi:serine/threonine protein kinase